MGTSGYFGVEKEGVLKGSYNHFDSYPDGLGQDIVDFVKKMDNKKFTENIKSVELVDEDAKPTDEQKSACIKYFNSNVSSKSTDEWYCLLRNIQGVAHLEEIEKGDCKYMINGNNFPFESLFCEWAYIINLDNDTFEIYKGFQKSQNDGRFKTENSDNGYFGCQMVKSIPFDNIHEEYKKFIESISE